MSNSHGDLFTEIGRLVLAANSGQAIDLNATVKDLSERYRNLGMTEETMMKVVTRSIGAISYSMARTNSGLQERLEALREAGRLPGDKRAASAPQSESNGEDAAMIEAQTEDKADATPVARSSGRRSRRPKSSSSEAKGPSPFPSGVRLALIP